jgi:hypothetical protein
MGAFDDLIPRPAGGGGLFDDLIPQPAAGPVTPPNPPGFTAPTGPALAPPSMAGRVASGVRETWRGAAQLAGAPVDLVNSIMGKVGLPTSDRPFMGSRMIDEAVSNYAVDPTIEAITGRQETADLQKANPNVPTEGGAPIGQRVYGSFMNTPDALDRYLTNTYGAEGQGWYKMSDQFGKPTERRVVRDKSGQERIFNPPGLDRGDVASMVGGVPDFLGGVGGAVASIPAYVFGPGVGIPASGVASAAGSQLVGESVGRLFPENRASEPDVLGQVVPRAAKEGAVDALVGTIMGGVGRLGVGIANKVRAPFAQSASDPLATEFRGAADRLKTQGYDIAPLPSEGGAGGFVPRMEGFLEKLPGSAEKMRTFREGGDKAISQFQGDIGGGVDPAKVGREAVSEISTQRQNLRIDREEGLARADDMLAKNEAGLLERQGPLVGAEAAGAQAKAGLEGAREGFKKEAKRLYDTARALPGGTDPIVDMAPVKAQVKAIRTALPPTQEGGASGQFAPDGLNTFLSGVDSIADNVTIDQAKQMRTLVYDALDDKTILPGVSERYLSELGKSLTSAIDGSVKRAGTPELQKALTEANTFYAGNVDKFSRRGVAENFRDPTQPGYVEDNQVVSKLLQGAGKPGVIRDMKATMGENSPQWAAARRQAVEQIMDSGRNQTLYGRKVVNVDGLVGRLNQLDDETVKELFGVADAKQLRNLAADVSNRTKYLDAGAMSQNGSPNIMQQLRSAATADEQISRDYRNNVIGPFLRGEDGAAAKMNPDELVPFLYRKASPDEIRNVIGRLPPDMKGKVEKAAVSDIIENAISKGRGDIDAVRRLVTGQANPASSQGIAEVLGAGKDAASTQQRARVEALLSPESRQALQDLALITARRQERDATTSAIGGLAAGAAVTNMLSNPASGFQAAAVARGLAQLVTNPSFRKWATNTKQTVLSPATMAQMPNVGETLADILAGAGGENSDIEAAGQWLRQGVSQVDEQGRRALKPPDGASSWEQYFGGKREPR